MSFICFDKIEKGMPSLCNFTDNLFKPDNVATVDFFTKMFILYIFSANHIFDQKYRCFGEAG